MTLQEIASQIRAGTIDLGRKHYALGLAHGILQAYHCGYDKITAIEFGVGEGLVCGAHVHLDNVGARSVLSLNENGASFGGHLQSVDGFCVHLKCLGTGGDSAVLGGIGLHAYQRDTGHGLVTF